MMLNMITNHKQENKIWLSFCCHLFLSDTGQQAKGKFWIVPVCSRYYYPCSSKWLFVLQEDSLKTIINCILEINLYTKEQNKHFITAICIYLQVVMVYC